jgi:hypothetical protein
MFTSGYNDSSFTGTVNTAYNMGSANAPMLSRIWRITKFEINVEM